MAIGFHPTQAIGGLIRDAEFAVMDAQAIEAEDSSFDLVIANHILYHVPDRRKALSEIHRVLKIGGRAVMTANGPSGGRPATKGDAAGVLGRWSQ